MRREGIKEGILDSSFRKAIFDRSFRNGEAEKRSGGTSAVARPKAFEPAVVLERAMCVFWRKGYERTSIQDLVDYTGVNRFSLYSAFGDKRGIFRAACDRYRRTVVGARLAVLERPPGGLAAIRMFFAGLVDALTDRDGLPGCLMTNCLVEAAPEDGDAVHNGREHLARMEVAFQAALRGARARGEIGRGRDLQDCASYLTATAQGLAVVGRISPDRRLLGGIVRTAMTAIG